MKRKIIWLGCTLLLLGVALLAFFDIQGTEKKKKPTNGKNTTQEIKKEEDPKEQIEITYENNPIDNDYNAVFELDSEVNEEELNETYYYNWENELDHAHDVMLQKFLYDRDTKEWAGQLRKSAKSNAQKEYEKVYKEVLSSESKEEAVAEAFFAKGEVLKEAVFQYITKLKELEYNYEFCYDTSYRNILQQIAQCEIFHYDAFISEPDEITTNLLIQNMVNFSGEYTKKDDCYDKGAYYFSSIDRKGKERKEYILPQQLYSNYFVKGSYQFSDQVEGIESYEDGFLVVANEELPLVATVKEQLTMRDGNQLSTLIQIGIIDNETGLETKVGRAEVTLEYDVTLMRWKVKGFVPRYEQLPELEQPEVVEDTEEVEE